MAVIVFLTLCLQVTINGLTGRVSVDENGQRLDLQFDILNLRKDKFHVVSILIKNRSYKPKSDALLNPLSIKGFSIGNINSKSSILIVSSNIISKRGLIMIDCIDLTDRVIFSSERSEINRANHAKQAIANNAACA